MLKTPVLFLIFNRPDVTFRVFEEIRKAQPEQLYIAADGPREEKEGEAEKCLQARSILNKIDWKCEVKTLFRPKNLGCRDAVSSAIAWFFDNVEEGIILEDDCLPDSSFFTFCQTLLEKYRSNENIMHIGGTNFQDGIKRGDASYYYSKYAHIWGWATWKRAWKFYDPNMFNLDDYITSKKIKNKFIINNVDAYWFKKFSETFEGKINTWDYQWVFCLFYYNGISIVPNYNLISNIGFNSEATHTNEDSYLSKRPTETIISIKHTTTIKINQIADEYTNKFFFNIRSSTIIEEIISRFKHYLLNIKS